jgi:predicted alpha/beta superfamily hydrolase
MTTSTSLPDTALPPGAITMLGPFVPPGLETPRAVRVYVPRAETAEPRGHDSRGPAHMASSGPRRVLYLFDGQNVFDDAPSFAGGWHVHTAVEGLVRRGVVPPVVVGIDHGGPRRIDELSPFRTPRSTGQLDRLLDWIAGFVAPAVAARTPVVRGPEGVVIGGSSMGGLAALYAHFRRPDAFGGAMSLSPSLWFASGRILDYVTQAPLPAVSRIYLDGGAREGRGGVTRLGQQMARLLTGRGYDATRLRWRVDPRGAHTERDWRRRTPTALRFVFV